MQKISDSKQYFLLMERNLNELGIKKYPTLMNYFLSIKEKFLEYEKNTTPETFFYILSKVLRLDAKLVLLGEEMKYIDQYGLTELEIINQIEKDSEHINKEMCGYKVNEEPHISLIFNTWERVTGN